MQNSLSEIIHDRVTCQEVVEYFGFELNRAKNILCPFHEEKTPSLHIYDDGWKCFGCGAGGDCISFVMKLKGISFIEAVAMLDSVFHLNLLEEERPAGPKPPPRWWAEIDAYEEKESLLLEWQKVIDTADPDGNLWAGAVRYVGRLRCELKEMEDAMFDKGIRKGETAWMRIKSRS